MLDYFGSIAFILIRFALFITHLMAVEIAFVLLLMLAFNPDSVDTIFFFLGLA